MVVLASGEEGNVSIVAAVTKDLTAKVQAGKLVGAVAQAVGGKGGGRPDMAEGGGKDAAAVDAARSKTFIAKWKASCDAVTESFDAIVVGAGPTGLACGIELQQRGVKTVLVEKGCVVNSIYHYPTNMRFFTTPELLEIGDIPMTSLNEKPNRTEALKYYRRVADHYKLDIRQYERVDRIEGGDNAFPVRHHRPPGLPPPLSRRARSSWPPDTTTFRTCSTSPARNSKGSALLQGAAPLLQPRRGRDRRQELRRHRRAGTAVDRRPRNSDSPRRRHFGRRQVLDQSEYRKPNQER